LHRYDISFPGVFLKIYSWRKIDEKTKIEGNQNVIKESAMKKTQKIEDKESGTLKMSNMIKGCVECSTCNNR
jgi:hypothetical protein